MIAGRIPQHQTPLQQQPMATSPGSWEGEKGRPASNIKNSHNLPLPTTDWRPNCHPVRDIKHFLRRKFLFRAQLQSFLSLSCELAGFVISYDKEKLRSNRTFVAAVKRLARNVGTFPRGRRWAGEGVTDRTHPWDGLVVLVQVGTGHQLRNRGGYYTATAPACSTWEINIIFFSSSSNTGK